MTGARCRICRHASRIAIEVACESESSSDVALRFGVSEFALERHLAAHAPKRAECTEPLPPTERCPLFQIEDAPSSRLRRIVLEALDPHPEAKSAVLAVLEREECAA